MSSRFGGQGLGRDQGHLKENRLRPSAAQWLRGGGWAYHGQMLRHWKDQLSNPSTLNPKP